MEYRVYAALLLDLEYNGRRNFKTPNNFKRASPNRLKTGLQTSGSLICLPQLRPSAVQILRFPDARNFKSEKKSPV
jgi:hypothetical protein